MCGSNRWLTIPPREWVGTSQVFRAQPRGYHWIFVPDPRGYHWTFVPDPRGYHWVFVPDPRGYHWIFVPDPGNITDFSSEKVICPGGGWSTTDLNHTLDDPPEEHEILIFW